MNVDKPNCNMEIAIMSGMILKCIFSQKLPGKEHGPNLKQNETYKCLGVHLDSKGNPHIDIGLPLEINYVSSYATGEELPPTTHWCHPNRFVVI